MGVEILTPAGTGKDGHGKFVGTVCREYERKIKGYMYLMGKESAGTSIQVPGARGVTLGIRQSFLVMQVSMFETMNTSLDIAILDSLQRKYRMQFSNRFKKFVVNDLHAQIPWIIDSTKNDWFQIVFDLSKLVACCFGATFCSLDSFTLKPAMKVRNIFSLPALVEYDSSEIAAKTLTGTPKSSIFPSSLQYRNVLFNDRTFMEIMNSLPSSNTNNGEFSRSRPRKANPKDDRLEIEGMSVGVTKITKNGEPKKISSSANIAPISTKKADLVENTMSRDTSFDKNGKDCLFESEESDGNRDQLKLIKKKDQNLRSKKQAQAGGSSTATPTSRAKAVLSEYKTLKSNSNSKSTSPNKRYADVELNPDEIHNFVVRATDYSEEDEQEQEQERENENFNTTGQTSPSNPWGSFHTAVASKAPTFHSARKEINKAKEEEQLYAHHEEDETNNTHSNQVSSIHDLMLNGRECESNGRNMPELLQSDTDAAKVDDISYRFDHIGVFNMKNDKIDKLEEILKLASNTLKRAEASYTEEFGSES